MCCILLHASLVFDLVQQKIQSLKPKYYAMGKFERTEAGNVKSCETKLLISKNKGLFTFSTEKRNKHQNILRKGKHPLNFHMIP